MNLEDFWLHLGELNFGQGSENEKFNTYLWILDKLREDQEAGQTNLQNVKVDLYVKMSTRNKKRLFARKCLKVIFIQLST